MDPIREAVLLLLADLFERTTSENTKAEVTRLLGHLGAVKDLPQGSADGPA